MSPGTFIPRCQSFFFVDIIQIYRSFEASSTKLTITIPNVERIYEIVVSAAEEKQIDAIRPEGCIH